MDNWTWLIIIVVVIVFIALWLYLARKRRNAAVAEHRSEDAAEPNYTFDGVEGAERFGPAVLAAGAHVTFQGENYLVAGTAALREGDRVWYEHLLRDERSGTGGHWISVENIDDRVRLGWWDVREDVPSEPGARVTVDGRDHRQGPEGEADFAVSGLSGAVSQGRYRYRDFHADDDRGRVRIETWGEDAGPQASVGRFISHDELTVLPQDRQP